MDDKVSAERITASPPTSTSSSSSASVSPDSSSSGGADSKREADEAAEAACASSQMSASYHEIFDSQMPPSSQEGDAALGPAEDDRDDDEEEETIAVDVNPLCICDDDTEATTEYLTSKLVQDSIRWQREHEGARAAEASPFDSPSVPRRRTAVGKDVPAELATSLDPNFLLDIEQDARNLATSLDSLVESLSGVLHGASALTVDAVETYRDGVCKTCDAVDGNIKAMYQLMAKVEELNKSMAPAYRLGDQLKEIKRLLDVYEKAAGAK